MLETFGANVLKPEDERVTKYRIARNNSEEGTE